MNRRKFGALVLLAFMVLSISACTGLDANKESVDEVANVVSTGVENNQVVEESTNSINEVQTNEDESSNGDVSTVTSDNLGQSDVSIVTSDNVGQLDVSVVSDDIEESSSVNSGNSDIKNTELMKYMSSLRSKLESGKKVNIRVNDASEAGEMTYYMVDNKVVLETTSSGVSMLSIADGNKTYVVMGDSYYEMETESDIFDNLFVISEDNADELTFVTKENGYEYFNVEDDYSLITKVDGDNLVVYKGSLKNEYLRFTVSTVTVDDLVKADLTKYKKVSLSDLALSLND